MVRNPTLVDIMAIKNGKKSPLTRAAFKDGRCDTIQNKQL